MSTKKNLTPYAQKLLDPRWDDFRDKVFGHYGIHCTTCGEGKPGSKRHHVHHKRYDFNLEPWEYPMEDVTVLCRECHDEIHQCENDWRNLIRSLPSWAVPELQYLIDELKQMSVDDIRCVASHAKNDARKIRYAWPDISKIMEAEGLSIDDTLAQISQP